MFRRVTGPLGLSSILFLFAFSSCNQGGSGLPEATESIPQFELRKDQIERIETKDYEIVEVQDEGGVIRVDVSLPSPVSGGELERTTYNILHEIQAEIGMDDRLAVWTHHGEDRQLMGMAFYSPLTETYHFKTADELN